MPGGLGLISEEGEEYLGLGVVGDLKIKNESKMNLDSFHVILP